MKILFLIIKKLQGHLAENRLISIIYVLSFVVSVLVFTYIYNNFMPNVIRSAGEDSSDHFYKFQFSDEPGEDKNSDISWLRSFLKDYDTLYVEYAYSTIKTAENVEEVTVINEATGEPIAAITGDFDGIQYITAYKDDEIIRNLSEGRLEFTDEEKQGNLYVAILPANNPSLGGLRPSYTYEDCEYKAIGWHAGSTEMIIPEELFFKKGFDFDKVTIYLNNTLTAAENKEFVENICNMYNVERVVSPEIMDEIYLQNSRQIAFMLIIGFLVMIFVFGFLIQYILIAGRNENVIYRLVGAGNGEIITITIMESLFINIILSVLSVVIHALLYNKVFNKLNLYDNVKLGISDYMFIVGITTIFSFIAILPHIIKSIRYTLIKSKG